MTSKTIALTGAEIRADYSGGANAWLRNDGTATVYASTAPAVTPGADGTVSIPAGQSVGVYGANGTVYLMGIGSVQLIGSDYSTIPFRNSAASGGSGADEQARAAIEAHAGNADIHVTADEKAYWNTLSCKNELDNPDFRVNQRGLAAYHSSGYTVDRWKIVDATWCEPLSGGGMKITASENSSDIPARAVQVVENAAALAGKKRTISCEVLSTTAANSAIFLAMYNSDGKGTYKGKTGLSVGVNQHTVDIPADTTAIQVWLIGADTRVGDEDGMYTEFAWAKLEVGNSATPFVPPDPATELLKCQRYFTIYKHQNATSITDKCTIGVGYALTSSIVYALLPIAAMRSGVTSTISHSGLSLISGADTVVDYTSVTALEQTESTVQFAFAVSDQTPGTVYRLRLMNSNAYLAVSKEL